MFVKKVSVLVVIALVSIAVSNVSSAYIDLFHPNFFSPTLVDHFRCVADAFVDVLIANGVAKSWPREAYKLHEKIVEWIRCVQSSNLSTKVDCNGKHGIEAYTELDRYMHVVENLDPKIIKAFLQKQQKECGPEGERGRFLNEILTHP